MSTCTESQTATASPSVKPYKRLLLEAREVLTKLRKQTGLAVFRMMGLLVQVYDDVEFRADHPGRDGQPADDLQAAAVLNDYVLEQTGLEFLQLRAMREHYPKETQWKDGRLIRMYDAMIESRRTKTPKAPRGREPVLTKAEFQAVSRAVERQKVQLQSANEQLQAATADVQRQLTEVERLRARVVELEARIATLESENAELRARVK